jgi:ketosteroid isomerase-like protein
VHQPEHVKATLGRINQAWLEGTPDAIGDGVADEVVMVFPGFGGSIRGREAFVATFREFLKQASIRDFTEADLRVDIAGNTAVATYRFEMVYERGGGRYRSTGRDFLIFENQAGKWLAVWRTMLDLAEEPVREI